MDSELSKGLGKRITITQPCKSYIAILCLKEEKVNNKYENVSEKFEGAERIELGKL